MLLDGRLESRLSINTAIVWRQQHLKKFARGLACIVADAGHVISLAGRGVVDLEYLVVHLRCKLLLALIIAIIAVSGSLVPF